METKKRYRKVGRLLAAALCCLALAAGLYAVSFSASAETFAEMSGSVDITSFEMVKGASIRMGNADGQNGIRFAATIDKAAYDQLEALESDGETKVGYGMLIVPEGVVAAESLTENLLAGGEYCFNNDGESCATGKAQDKHIATVRYETLCDDDETDGKMNLRGSLVGIRQANLTREMVGRAFIEVEKNGEKSYAVAKYAENSAENNTRSVTYVAQKACEDQAEPEANKETLKARYIDEVADKNVEYTVNHYLPTGGTEDNPTYGDPVVETLTGTLNAKVTATNIARTALNDTGTYRQYITYAFDLEKEGALTTSTLYANGKTVLNCYYKQADTTLWSANDPNDLAAMQQANDNKQTNNSVTAVGTGEKVDFYTDGKSVTENNVYKLETTGYQYGSGRLYVGVTEEKLAIAEGANWDYLEIRLAIVKGPETGDNPCNDQHVSLFTGKLPLTDGTFADPDGENADGVPLNEWTTIRVSKSTLLYTDGDQTHSMLYNNGEAMINNKADFDKKIRELLINPKKTLFIAENFQTSKGGSDTHNLIYYIKDIKWGIDVDAPEITGISKPTYGTNYTPAVVVADEINHTSKKGSSVYGGVTNIKTELYKTEGQDQKTLIEPQVDGSYANLEKGVKYTLKVTVDDSPLPDVVGNVITEEFAISVRDEHDILVIDDRFDLASVEARTLNGVVPTMSVIDSVDDKENVLEYKSNNAPKGDTEWNNYGGYFFLTLGDTEAQAVMDALNKYSDFALKMDIKITISPAPGQTGKKKLNIGARCGTEFDLDAWNTLTFTKEDLTTAKWAEKTNGYDRLTGRNGTGLFYLDWDFFNKSNTFDTKYDITIYIDHIWWEGSVEAQV